jgi:hypothetical protein
LKSLDALIYKEIFNYPPVVHRVFSVDKLCISIHRRNGKL